MANKADHQAKTPGSRTTRQHTPHSVVTLADLAPRHDVTGGAARVFGEASEPVSYTHLTLPTIYSV